MYSFFMGKYMYYHRYRRKHNSFHTFINFNNIKSSEKPKIVCFVMSIDVQARYCTLIEIAIIYQLWEYKHSLLYKYEIRSNVKHAFGSILWDLLIMHVHFCCVYIIFSLFIYYKNVVIMEMRNIRAVHAIQRIVVQHLWEMLTRC